MPTSEVSSASTSSSRSNPRSDRPERSDPPRLSCSMQVRAVCLLSLSRHSACWSLLSCSAGVHYIPHICTYVFMCTQEGRNGCCSCAGETAYVCLCEERSTPTASGAAMAMTEKGYPNGDRYVGPLTVEGLREGRVWESCDCQWPPMRVHCTSCVCPTSVMCTSCCGCPSGGQWWRW